MATSHRRALVRISILGAFALGIGVLTAGTAFAAVTSSVTNGVLMVSTSAGDLVTVTCDTGGTRLSGAEAPRGFNGFVWVNGADPGSGQAACDSITKIIVEGDSQENGIDLSGVTPALFPGINSKSNLLLVRVNGRGGGDVMLGSGLNDRLIGSFGGQADFIDGGGGNDVITGGVDDDQIFGGAGFDTLYEHSNVNFTLTDASLTGLGTDTLASIERAKLYTGIRELTRSPMEPTRGVVGIYDNTIDASGFTGPVLLSGGAGNDVLVGGSANDLLRSSSGNDSLTGGPGDDRLFAGNGDDTLDSVDAVTGNDYLQGERGADTCTTDPDDTAWSCEF